MSTFTRLVSIKNKWGINTSGKIVLNHFNDSVKLSTKPLSPKLNRWSDGYLSKVTVNPQIEFWKYLSSKQWGVLVITVLCNDSSVHIESTSLIYSIDFRSQERLAWFCKSWVVEVSHVQCIGFQNNATFVAKWALDLSVGDWFHLSSEVKKTVKRLCQINKFARHENLTLYSAGSGYQTSRFRDQIQVDVVTSDPLHLISDRESNSFL